MDKKKQINFNLNNFLLAISTAYDYKNNEYFDKSLIYSKRVAFIALNIGNKLNLTPQEMSDLCSYSLSHSIAVIKIKEESTKYYKLSEKIINKFPFLLEKNNILMYQREYYDGTGPFNLKDDEIPLLSKILSFSIEINSKFDLSNSSLENKEKIKNYIIKNSNILFSKEISDIFLELSKNISFYLDLKGENSVLNFIFTNLYDFTIVLDFEDLLELTSTIFYNMNEKSNLLNYCEKACTFYNFEHKDKLTFLITASTQNIGKLFIEDKILNKSTTLSESEYETVKSYPYHTQKVLDNIISFNDISSWASKIQEQINGKGYPYSLSGKNLSLKDRLLACLVAYDALRTEKPYRNAYNHNESIKVLNILAKEGRLDASVIKDLDLFLK